MPMKVKDRMTGGIGYATPFVGPVNHTEAVEVDLSALTGAEVDSLGYIKPGVPLTSEGKLVVSDGQEPAGPSGPVHVVTIEPIKVYDGPGSSEMTGKVVVVGAVIGAVNQAIIEDNLGRALTEFEVAAFKVPGCLIRLIEEA